MHFSEFHQIQREETLQLPPKPPKSRNWRGSIVAPFAGNNMLVLYSCPANFSNNYFVQVLHNEQPVPMPVSSRFFFLLHYYFFQCFSSVYFQRSIFLFTFFMFCFVNRAVMILISAHLMFLRYHHQPNLCLFKAIAPHILRLILFCLTFLQERIVAPHMKHDYNTLCNLKAKAIQTSEPSKLSPPQSKKVESL